jgi:peptidoglycan hydrolase-like protein with peptidoglycan-binding domain
MVEGMTEEPELARGAENEWVTYLQQMLNRLGIYDGRTDGSFGEKTETSVATLQQQYAIDEDGRVGAATWKLIAMSREQPSEGATYEAIDSSVDTVEAPEFENEGTS